MQVRCGLVKVSDGKSLPSSVRLYLTLDTLHLQKQETCEIDANALDGDEHTPRENEVRTQQKPAYFTAMLWSTYLRAVSFLRMAFERESGDTEENVATQSERENVVVASRVVSTNDTVHNEY